MAQASRRLKRLRRVKRERSQLRQAVKVQQQQIQTVVKLLMDAQAELRKLKTPPSFTITTLADDVDSDVSDVPMPFDESDRAAVLAAGFQPVTAIEESHDDAPASDPS